ncbi:MAG: EamA family transporter [Desulfobacteraceae bacterium]|nr:EamA family transporter [Desulfobacteraceae bacterium]
MVKIHLAVFLFGFAGLFGKFLSCSPFIIVLGRTFFAAISLFVYAKMFSRTNLGCFDRTSFVFLILQGILLACHWVTFFLAIQISSVAVGLVTFSSFPLFVTFMEPYFFKEPLKKRDIATAMAVFAGILLVIPDVDLSNNITLGGFYGVLSGLTFAILALVNRRNARESDPIALAFYQNLFAALFLIFPILILKPKAPETADLPNLILLGVVFTAMAHTFFIQSLTKIRAQTASVIAGLEPVYGIVLAFFLLNEIPRTRTLAGGVVIITTTIIAGFYGQDKTRSS